MTRLASRRLVEAFWALPLLLVATSASADSLGIGTTAVTVAENAGSVVISIERTTTGDELLPAVDLTLATADGTATAGQDYTTTSGTVSFASGETGTKTISVPVLTDNLQEPDETFSIAFASCTAVIETPDGFFDVPCGQAEIELFNDTATVTIQDTSQGTSTVGLVSPTFTVAESAGSLQVDVQRTRLSDGPLWPVALTFRTENGTAVSGEDYGATTSTLSFGMNESGTKGFSIPILADNLEDPDEAFRITLSSCSVDVDGVSMPCDSSGTGISLGNRTATVTVSDTPVEVPPDPLANLKDLTNNPYLTPNQRRTLGGLLSACPSATGELGQRCREIDSVAALDAIIPDEVASMGTQAVDFGYKQHDIIHGRIVDLRNARGGFSLLGFNVDVDGESIPVGKTLMAALQAASGGAAGDGEEPFRDSPLGFFLKGQFNVGDKNRTSREQGFETDRKEVTLGLDYRFTDALVLGAAFGYAYVDTDYDHAHGEMTTDSLEFATYGSYFLPKDFYLEWVLSAGLHDYDLNRRIHYGDLDTTAKSSPDGDQYGISVGFGKDIYIDEFFLNPYVRVEYQNVGIDGYTEKGGAGLALEIGDQTIHSVTSTLGGQISRAFSMPWGILTPGMRFEWVHQYRDDNRQIQARFSQATQGSGSFAIITDNPDRNYFNLGASLAATLPEGRAAFLRYESRLGQDDISDHTVELGIRLPF